MTESDVDEEPVSDDEDEDEYLPHSHTDEPMLDITTHPDSLNQRSITTLIPKTCKQC